ncbi:tartronate semialdehyde reductase [compost metagenome]
MKIGYIGLGALGSQLARRFLSHSLCVWDINTVAVDTFKKLGADVAPTAADLARTSGQRCSVQTDSRRGWCRVR